MNVGSHLNAQQPEKYPSRRKNILPEQTSKADRRHSKLHEALSMSVLNVDSS
jgi:hypothetical protein